jgi:hypothetical protein
MKENKTIDTQELLIRNAEIERILLGRKKGLNKMVNEFTELFCNSYNSSPPL